MTLAPRYQPTIREMPAGERPRERLRDAGPEALSTGELLAILLRTGSTRENVLQQSGRLLRTWGGLGGLARVSFAELCAQHGMGEAKACQVKAALELGRRLAVSLSGDERPQISSPDQVAALIQTEMSLLPQESLRVVLLTTKNHVVGIREVYRGTVSSSQVRPAEVFREAVRETCPSIIVVHNHPSGDPTPSRADIDMTRMIVEAGRPLGVTVHDHVIVGRDGHASLRALRLI